MLDSIKIFVLAGTIFLVNSQTGPPKQCNGVDLKMSQDKITNVMECLKEAELEDFKDVTKENMPCFFTCVMKKRGVVDEGGVLKKDNISQLVAEGLPDDMTEDLAARIGACFDDHGSKVSPDDPTCVSPDLVDCFSTAYSSVCEA